MVSNGEHPVTEISLAWGRYLTWLVIQVVKQR